MATSEPGAYPVRVDIEYPERSSRWWALAAILFAVKAVFLLPHLIVLYVLQIVAAIAALIGWIAVIFTGVYPRGLFDFQVGIIRWGARVNAWFMSLTDAYPPFRLYD